MRLQMGKQQETHNLETRQRTNIPIWFHKHESSPWIKFVGRVLSPALRLCRPILGINHPGVQTRFACCVVHVPHLKASEHLRDWFCKPPMGSLVTSGSRIEDCESRKACLARAPLTIKSRPPRVRRKTESPEILSRSTS